MAERSGRGGASFTHAARIPALVADQVANGGLPMWTARPYVAIGDRGR